jgi:hypothetical protein
MNPVFTTERTTLPVFYPLTVLFSYVFVILGVLNHKNVTMDMVFVAFLLVVANRILFHLETSQKITSDVSKKIHIALIIPAFAGIVTKLVV